MLMKSDVKRLCDIKSLRELHKVQRANEAAKEAAAARAKSGIDGVFSLGRVLVSFVQHYAPENVRRIMTVIFQMNQG